MPETVAGASADSVAANLLPITANKMRLFASFCVSIRLHERGDQEKPIGPEPLCLSAFQSDLAVRVGFEPTVPFNRYNALAKRRFRPLSHLTKFARRIYGENLAGVKSKSDPPKKCSFDSREAAH